MRYEELKKQTQAELKATLDDLLEGDDKVFPPKDICIRSLRIQPLSRTGVANGLQRCAVM